MIDFTSYVNGQLDDKSLRLYEKLRATVVAFFIAGILLFVVLVLFPSQNFVFLFSTPNSTKNTVTNITGQDGKFPEKGLISGKNKLNFYTSSPEKFSEAQISLTLNKNASEMQEGKLTTIKSYKAFLYPVAQKPAGFKDGALIQNNESFYIISAGKLRKFSSLQILQAMGYAPEYFVTVSAEELQYNGQGENITNPLQYPDSALIKIADDYYQLRDNTLYKFVSEKAYLNNYDPKQAVAKNDSFLDQFKTSPELLGFSDGTFISSATSVYIVRDNTILPIDSPITFTALGFDWSDVIPVTEEELGIYEKGKLFTIDQPHPQGTILATTESGKYYLVSNQEKLEIKGPAIIKSYLNRNPVLIDEKGPQIQSSCALKKQIWPLHTYSCKMTIEAMGTLMGKDYQFKFENDKNIQIETVNVSLERNINWENFKLAFFNIKKKFIEKYGESAVQ